MQQHHQPITGCKQSRKWIDHSQNVRKIRVSYSPRTPTLFPGIGNNVSVCRKQLAFLVYILRELVKYHVES